MNSIRDTRSTSSVSPTLGRRKFITAGALGSAGLALGAGMGSNAHASRPDPDTRIAEQYSGKVVLITGATSGIGKAAAHAYARRGAKVFFCGRRQRLGRQVEKAIRDKGGEATYMRTDVREQEQVRRFVDECVATYDGLDIAFNNAGIAGHRGNLVDVPTHGEGSYHDLFRTHVDGVYYALLYEIPIMRENGGGVIVNNASMRAHSGAPSNAAYSASKHAVLGLTRSSAAAEAENKIRVFSISPGGTETELLRQFVGGSLEGVGEDSPMGRIAQPSEIADVLVNLTVPEALFLNGDDIKIDGASGAA